MKARLFPAVLLLGSARAAEADAPDLLPPWIVVETRLQPDATPIRASALLPAEAWSGRSIATLADAFRSIPGAVMLESFGGFEPPRLSIRGSGIQSAPSSRGLALLLDRLPLGLADGSFNTGLLDPLLAARVEVQRGLDGWRTAPATMGGALDLRDTRPDGATIRFEAGSFGAYRARAAGPGAAVSFVRQDGYREHSGQQRTTALASAGHRFAAGIRAQAGIYHARARYAVPGPLTLAAALSGPRGVSDEVLRDRPRRASELTRVAATVAHASAPREFELGLALARTADDFHQLQGLGVSRSRSDDASVHATIAQRFTTGPVPHQLRLTASATRGWRELQRFRNDTGRTGPRFGYDRLFPTTAALQLEDAFAPAPKIVGTIGIARIAARRDVADRLGPAATARLSSGETLPQASLRWNATRGIAVFAGVSTAAEPPTFDDLFVVSGRHPELRRSIQHMETQRAATWELGARRRSAKLAWDVAVYHADWRNEILRLADAHGNPQGAVNATPTTHSGLETSLRWLLLDRGVRLSLAASATWTRFRFDADPVYGSGRLAGMPPHLGSAELTAEHPRGGYAAIGIDWTHGRTLVDHAGRLSYGGRTLAHARTGWRFGSTWTCFIEARNLFDRASIASTAGVLDLARHPAATAIFLPAPGRAFVLGVEWSR